MASRRRLPRWQGELPLLLAAAMCTGTAVAAPRLLAEPLELPGQAQPSVAVDRDRGYVLTWIDREAGSAHLRFAQLARDGKVSLRGDIASGSDWFINWADFPSLAVADNGDWVTFFLRKSDPSRPYAYDVMTTRSTDLGRSWSTPSRLHDDGSATEHGFVSLLPDGGERVLALWLDGRNTGGGGSHDHADGHAGPGSMTLRSAVLLRDGGPREPHELDPRTCDCCSTAALRTDAGPLVAYRDRSNDEVRDIAWLQRTGSAWSAPRIVHEDGWQTRACPVNGPALALAGKAPALAWTTQHEDGLQVRVSRGNPDSTWTAPRTLDLGSPVLGRVDASAWQDDGLLVSWIGTRDDGQPGHALRVTWLDADLETIAALTVTHIPQGRSVGTPRLASHDGTAILVWTESAAALSRVRGVLLRADAAD